MNYRQRIITTIILLLLAIGFPVAVLLAWAFELTPEGLKREKDIETIPAGRRGPGRNLDAAVFGVLDASKWSFYVTINKASGQTRRIWPA